MVSAKLTEIVAGECRFDDGSKLRVPGGIVAGPYEIAAHEGAYLLKLDGPLGGHCCGVCVLPGVAKKTLMQTFLWFLEKRPRLAARYGEGRDGGGQPAG